MKVLVTILLTLLSASVWSQNIRFKIVGQQDTTVHLVRYFGSKLFYADTAMIKNGIVEFQGSKQKPGMMALLLPGQQLLEFVYNNEEVSIEATKPDLVKTTKIKKSAENQVFNEYVQFISDKRGKNQELVAKRDALDKNSPEYKQLDEEITTTNQAVKDYQNKLVADHPDMLISKMIYMSMDIDIPEPPKDENGNIKDSSFSYNYFRDHFFDHVDLKDDRLVNSPIFHNKLEYYFGPRMMHQHWDSIIKYAFKLCDQLDPKSKMFEYCVSHITSTFGKSKQMGMDKVYLYMIDRYYCSRNEDGSSPAFWMTEPKLEELCKDLEYKLNTVLGIQAKNIILPDTTDLPWTKVNWINMHNIDAEYTILYFWDPECGHCKKVTPKLQRLYEEKFKGRGIEIYAVGKAIDTDYEKWKKFIRDNKLTFINVAVTNTIFKVAKEDARQLVPKYTTLESLNVQQTYDIFSTPRVFVLNKNKEIIAKQLSISQLEDLMDRLQNKTDLPKLFPPDPEEDEHMN